ncbi:hypothetical protein A3740_17430 [Oleiphilus sp. HI0068]|nr:hypothetical protein A3740_17430 [Oleiphilus sp. HI0068]KZY81323.1 hypothetical protein A3741_17410 [Oleiphilus sp. HI0069]KZY87189.1 hypothetical protein A3741_25735 [Oleiphilus sp. HI0069]KZZ44702.1 hypothetical protein A3755_20610 [Oleiphilus sp. HI0085]
MTTYSVTCTVQGLEPLHVALLEQAGCHVTDDRVSYDISLQTEETDNEFTERSKRWINRELSRVNALTERFFEATAFEFEPRIGNITVRPAAAWGYVPQKPPSHNGWEDEGLEFRLNAWNVASKTEDVVLRFVMLDTICESTEVNQDWADRDKWPPRFAEVRLVRNLLVHGKEV